MTKNSYRGLSTKFLDAMRDGLERGRRRGYKGWDEGWRNVSFPCSPRRWMIMRLHQEVDELIVALDRGDPKERVVSEAADIANFAMFIADIVDEGIA